MLLVMHLSEAQQPRVRMKVAEIYRVVPRLQGAELLAALHPLVVEVLALVAKNLAGMLGVNVADMLRFSDLTCRDEVLRGTRAVKRRLDRIWNGTDTSLIEALVPTSLLWPGPRTGYCIVLRGDVEVDHAKAELHCRIAISLGAEVSMGAEAELLLRRSPIGHLLEVAQAAGMQPSELIANALGERQQYPTAAGLLELEPAGCRLGGRRIRLTVAETALLRRLAQSNGKVVAKSELASAAGIGLGRNVDHLAMGVRNKLGDGVIATVYGVGFALETRDPAQQAAPGL